MRGEGQASTQAPRAPTFFDSLSNDLEHLTERINTVTHQLRRFHEQAVGPSPSPLNSAVQEKSAPNVMSAMNRLREEINNLEQQTNMLIGGNN